MELEFEKLNGAGNDFIMIDDMSDEITLTPEQVASICDRHFGVGGDGVILVKPSKRPECAAYMDYYNSDGTKAQMCGNGVRCFAKFLVDNGIVNAADGSFIADTLSGPKPIEFTLNAAGELETATVDMGAPILEPMQVPVDLPGTENEYGTCVIEEAIDIHGDPYRFTCVSMGNPHAITFVDEDGLELVQSIGPSVEVHEVFPENTNVEFAAVDGDAIKMRVWERGCGETLACGTGACATAVAAHITGRSGREVELELLGGTLHIIWREADGHVLMTGPAARSFTGTLTI